ncbi:hypothetical protein BKH43_01250 [Helicobacter sp. 13S00401-1]|uniref:hypothetical protein n=1 Tax=Helicobacter sp. 13S00401-1 TaxID=1905758 RepID=UPI000BA5F256|nr:hypothetical protein [Helicobacter sp. 13S00401-1]PAF51887.1 hypothetical protein BKH43_01250 [Helicobacter sp. 13S00401-1]
MKHLKYLLLVLVLFFIACAGQKSFSPSVIDGKLSLDKDLPSPIVDSNLTHAKLKDGMILDKEGLKSLKLEKGENVVFSNDKYFVINNTCKELEVVPYKVESTTMLKDSLKLDKVKLEREDAIKFKVDSCAVSGALRDNLLALVMQDNTAVIYDLAKKDRIFIDRNDPIYAVTNQITSPIFEGDSVIYPMLDGRVVFVDLKELKVIRSSIIGGDKFLNNITFIDASDSVVIAATPKRIVSFVEGQSYTLDGDIRYVKVYKGNIFVLNLEGDIAEYDPTLRLLNKIHLPYAKFSGIGFKDNTLYTLERSGFLIEVNLNDFTYKVYKASLHKNKEVFFTDGVFYNTESSLNLAKPNITFAKPKAKKDKIKQDSKKSMESKKASQPKEATEKMGL